MSLMQMFRQWLGKSADDAQTGRRPDGGTSCFRPNRKAENRSAAGAMSAIQTEMPHSNVSYVHTGFTGMNPPQSDVYQPVGGKEASGWNGWQQQTQTGFYTGYQPNAASAAAQTVQGSVQDRFQTPQNQGRRAGRRRGEESTGNVFFMPGAFPGQPTQPLPQQVERILNMNGLKSCYEAIDCMKNGETLIVLMEMIESEGEVVRCQDMLTGAAFTLGCTVRMLRGSRLILIAPPQVRILPEENPSINTQPFNSITEMAAEGISEPQNMFETGKTENQRKRRVSQNTRGWRPGEDRQVNPYTGTMPAASGAYGGFGGFR